MFRLKSHRQAKLRTMKFFTMCCAHLGSQMAHNLCFDSYHVCTYYTTVIILGSRT